MDWYWIVYLVLGVLVLVLAWFYSVISHALLIVIGAVLIVVGLWKLIEGSRRKKTVVVPLLKMERSPVSPPANPLPTIQVPVVPSTYR